MLPTYAKKFTPRQLNALVDDAIKGIFIPLGQPLLFEKALHELARNKNRTEDDIARVRDMTHYNWQAAAKRKPDPALEPRLIKATHVTEGGILAAHIREGVYLIDGKLPVSDIEAQVKGIKFKPVNHDHTFTVTSGVLAATLGFQHPALEH
jgi:hypothetical protein